MRQFSNFLHQVTFRLTKYLKLGLNYVGIVTLFKREILVFLMPPGTKQNELYNTKCNFNLCLVLVQNIKEQGVFLNPAELHTLLHEALSDRFYNGPIISPLFI